MAGIRSAELLLRVFVVLCLAPAPAAAQKAECKSETRFDKRTSDSVFRHANEFRRGAGRVPFKRYASLDEVARLYAKYLCDNDYFDHETENGFGVLDRTQIHARDLFFARVGENLYLEKSRNGERIPAYLGMAEEKGREMEEGWEDSPGHRKNLLVADFNGIGIGVAHARDRKVGVQVFVHAVGEMADELEWTQRIASSKPLDVSLRVPVSDGKRACLVQLEGHEPPVGEDREQEVVGCGIVRDWGLQVDLKVKSRGLSNLAFSVEGVFNAWGPSFVGVQ